MLKSQSILDLVPKEQCGIPQRNTAKSEPYSVSKRIIKAFRTKKFQNTTEFLKYYSYRTTDLFKVRGRELDTGVSAERHATAVLLTGIWTASLNLRIRLIHVRFSPSV